MAQLFANAARSTLTASITNSSTQLQINPADQALFPVATGADWFKVALEDSSGNLEYMRVQRAVGQSLLTITERATEDATKFPARAFVAGSLVELRMTAADLASSIAHPNVGTGAHAATAISVTSAGGISAATVQAALQELDSEKANAADVATALSGKASTGANTFTGAQTLAGNAVNPLEAVPKQQMDAADTATLASANSATTAAKTATEAKLIGFSQTWQAVSRAGGTAYTNDTGRPITLVVNGVTSGANVAGTVTITFSGGIAFNFAAGGGATLGQTFVYGTVVIPIGATYTLTYNNIAGGVTTYELR